MTQPPWFGWPPAGPRVSPLTAHAGPDASVALGVPTALAGSATNGTPPYVFLWSVLLAPAGGVVVFVDDTDPTTNATFTVANGVYRLDLRVTDALGAISVAGVTYLVGGTLWNALPVFWAGQPVAW